MYVNSVSETCQFAEGFESLVITALSEQDGRSYGSAMRAPLFSVKDAVGVLLQTPACFHLSQCL